MLDHTVPTVPRSGGNQPPNQHRGYSIGEFHLMFIPAWLVLVFLVIAVVIIIRRG